MTAMAARARGRFHPASSAAVWIPLVVVASGFGLILLGWALVAGRDNTTAQMTPLVAACGGGLAMVAAGVAALARAVSRRDAIVRERHLEQVLSLSSDEDAA